MNAPSKELLARALMGHRQRDPELEWWGAYNRGVARPPLAPDVAARMIDSLPACVARGSLSAAAATLARQAIEKSIARFPGGTS